MRTDSPRKEASRRYYEANKEKIKARVAKYRAENHEEILEKKRGYSKKVNQEDWWKEKHSQRRALGAKKWRSENPSHVKNYNQKYKLENKELCEEIRSRRVSSKRGRTPKWLTMQQKKPISEFSLVVKALNKLAGYRAYHVDHIIPLQGENVSGLHVPWNMQILTASENSSKNDKCDGTMNNNSWRLTYE